MTVEEFLAMQKAGQCLPVSPQVGAINPLTPVVNASLTCPVSTTIEATPNGIGIDPANLVGKQCGFIKQCVNNSGTNSVDVVIPFGMCMTAGMHALWGNLTPAGVYAVDSAGFLSCNSFYSTPQPFAAGIQLQNELTCTTSLLVGDITFRRAGAINETTDAAFNTLASSDLRGVGVNIGSNFDICTRDIPVNVCPPCPDSSNNVIAWQTGGYPLSNRTGLFLQFPAGLRGEFNICVISVAGVNEFTACGAPTPRY